MSFQAAELVATIQLGGVSTAERDLDRFKGKLEQTDQRASRLKAAGEAAFRGTATAIGVATVAAAAYVTKLFSTGVAYNTLQQTSRAAMRTLMGGAEQANAQMDKLDAFARNSPFSKAVFITAQQQLIGFGMEAQKVIPTLNAVQNAVAGVGGSNEDISEITRVLAQVQSANKITAETFNMLGSRGIDAADLIGKGMGKTADQIREDVSKGTLDARAALDVLVAQMDKTYAGAAANVKETFTGTVDRVRAASRDIGAALAEPFVSKNGGGLFVTWGNQVADVMRAVESHVSPVVSILTARATPAFAKITELLDKARIQIRSWDSSKLERGLDSMGRHAPAIAGVAGAILGVNTQLLASIPIVGKFVPSFSPVAGALGAIALASPEVRTQLSALLSTMEPLWDVAKRVAEVLSGVLNAALPIVADGIGLVVRVAEPLVGVLEAIPAPVLASTAAAVAMFAAMRAGTPLIATGVNIFKDFAAQVAASRVAAEASGGSLGTLGAAAQVSAGKVTGLGSAFKAAFITNPVGLIILGVSTAAAILTAAFSAQAQRAQEVKDRIAGYRDVLNETTGALTGTTRAHIENNLAERGALDLAERLGVSRREMVDAVLDGEDAVNLLNDAMLTEQATLTGSKSEMANYRQRRLELIQILGEEVEGLAAAAEETRNDAEEKRRAAAAMTEFERSNQRMAEALRIAQDASADATERLRALKLALDELNGGTKSQADVTRDLNEQTDRLREVLTATNEEGALLAPTLVDAAGAIDTTSAAGRALYDEVSRLNDQMLDAILLADKEAKARGQAGVSVEEARAIYARFSGQLEGLREAAGLTEGQMAGLVMTMLETPDVVAFMLDDSGTIDAAKLRLIHLAEQIVATPDGEFFVTDKDTIAGIEHELANMGFTIEHLPDGKVHVSATGVDSVESALNNLARTRYARVTPVYDSRTDSLAIPGRAGGGPIHGPGTSTSDSILARLSNDEHVWTAGEVRGAGGHGSVAMLRSLADSGQLGQFIPGFRDGGPVIRAGRLPELVATAQRADVLAPASSYAGASDPRIVALLERIADAAEDKDIIIVGRDDALSDGWASVQDRQFGV